MTSLTFAARKRQFPKGLSGEKVVKEIMLDGNILPINSLPITLFSKGKI